MGRQEEIAVAARLACLSQVHQSRSKCCASLSVHEVRECIHRDRVQLFKSEHPADAGDDWLSDMDTGSEEVLQKVFVSPRLAACQPFERFQLERLGYFCVDPDSKGGALVLNRTCSLRDTYRR